jgi:hypothetical protein
VEGRSFSVLAGLRTLIRMRIPTRRFVLGALARVFPAFLLACGTLPLITPTVDQIPPGEPLAIDGEWRLEQNGALYRLEGGRLLTVERSVVGLAHLDPGHVAVRDIRQVSARTYTGHEIPQNAPWHATVTDDGVIETRVEALLGTQHYKLLKERLDDPDWFAAQQAASSVLAAKRGAGGQLDLTGALGADVWKPGSDRSAFGRYHALVIGNNAYRSFEPLATAVHDARTVARVLEERYAMDVTLLLDASRKDILVALADLRRELADDDNLIIYYAGHGWLDEDAEEGYWLPVDATPDDTVNWIANSAITAYFKAIRAKHILVVADSCYAGTLTRGIRVDDAAPEHLRRMSERRARVVLTSGGVEPVADAGGGGHSAFAAAFIEALDSNRGVLDTTTLFTQIRRPVMLAADQAPELADIRKAGHEGGDFLFVPAR